MDVCWAFSSLVLLCSLLVDTELPDLENIPLEISCFNDGLVPKSILNRAAKAGALLSTMFFSPQPNQCKNGVEFPFIPKNLSYVEQKTCQTVMKDGITDDHAVQLTVQICTQRHLNKGDILIPLHLPSASRSIQL